MLLFQQFVGETTGNMTTVDAAWDPRKGLDYFRRPFVTLIPNTATCMKRNQDKALRGCRAQEHQLLSFFLLSKGQGTLCQCSQCQAWALGYVCLTQLAWPFTHQCGSDSSGHVQEDAGVARAFRVRTSEPSSMLGSTLAFDVQEAGLLGSGVPLDSLLEGHSL